MHGHLRHRAHQLGVGHAVRLLGHVEGPLLTRLLRAAEALVLPSRYRVAFDDAVVDLARRAGRPVVTTHGGPAHLVRHEENGIVTYDNPGSMVWALDRILGDPGHAEQHGPATAGAASGAPSLGRGRPAYLELCAPGSPSCGRDNALTARARPWHGGCLPRATPHGSDRTREAADHDNLAERRSAGNDRRGREPAARRAQRRSWPSAAG